MHRIVWSLVLLTALLGRRGELGTVLRVVRHRRLLVTLTASALLVALNWFLFIWAIANDRVLEASLGYFINPLVNVALGLVLLALVASVNATAYLLGQATRRHMQ